MTITCSPEYLDRAAKDYPEFTFLEYIAMLQTGRSKRICTNGKRQNRSRIWHDTSIKRKVPL